MSRLVGELNTYIPTLNTDSETFNFGHKEAVLQTMYMPLY